MVTVNYLVPYGNIPSPPKRPNHGAVGQHESTRLVAVWHHALLPCGTYISISVSSSDVSDSLPSAISMCSVLQLLGTL